MISLLYVSRAVLPTNGRELAVAQIVDTARAANAIIGVSGALIFTGSRFAQVLEGEQDVVQQLFEQLCRDSRHTDVVKLAECPVEARRFGGWSLAYAGPSAYVGRMISKPLAQTLRGSTANVHELVRLMAEFSMGQHTGQEEVNFRTKHGLVRDHSCQPIPAADI